MTSEQERLLRLFQGEENRLKEERFARGFTRKDDVKLAFINEGRAFTDGVNITVDPAADNMFTDEPAMKKTSELLNLKQTVRDPWTGLFMTARAQEVHECLHIIYTKFPPPAAGDVRSTDRIRMTVLAMIGNIIEDAFIENAGVSEFPETEIFLRWGRASHLFAAEPEEGTLSESLSFVKGTPAEKDKGMKTVEYVLGYSAFKLLYTMARPAPPEKEYEELIGRTEPLFEEGAVSGTPAERHRYACKIFDILEPFLPETVPQFTQLKRMLGGAETHGGSNVSLTDYVSEGRTAEVTRRLFCSLDGKPLDFDENGEILSQLLGMCSDDLSEAETAETFVIVPYRVMIDSSETDAAAVHRGIKIAENHPVPDERLKKSYRSVTDHYRRVINNYIRRFEKLIHTENTYTENKKYFGTGISSKDLADVKKRYWYRKYHEDGTPDIAVMILIDGSGSMFGERRNAAVQSAVILHEVLEAHHIEHCIVEHRAIYDEPLVEHNVLLDFRHRPDSRYNIMRLSAYDGTREGLSLFWAEKYMQTHSSAPNKVMMIVSDGYPEHYCDISDYEPPVSTQDTANAAAKISSRGTKITAAALGSDCYPFLKSIYPKTVECTDLEKLTGQLLKLISDELGR